MPPANLCCKETENVAPYTKEPRVISARLAAALGRRGVHYGWVVVATTFLTMLRTPLGAIAAWVKFYAPIAKLMRHLWRFIGA